VPDESQLTPAAVLAAPQPSLRACGLSERKASYLLDLAAHFQDGRLSDELLTSKQCLSAMHIDTGDVRFVCGGRQEADAAVTQLCHGLVGTSGAILSQHALLAASRACWCPCSGAGSRLALVTCP
jgi:hypothetical protein